MYSPITGVGSGSAPVVNITWPFLSKDHVKATVNGVSAALTWTGASQVTFAAAAPSGQAWAVYRDTPIDAPLTDFTDGAVLTEDDLDKAQNQQLYRQQEVEARAIPRVTLSILPVGSAPTAAITQQPDGWTLALGLPATAAVPDADYGDITVSGSGLVWNIDAGVIGTAELAADAVTYAKMQNVSAGSRFLGRITTGAGDPEELTGTQATTLLDTFTAALKGLVPASGGGTSLFLRADGTWATPPGGGAAGTTTNALTINNSGTGAASGSTFNGSAPITISFNSIGALGLTGGTMTGALITAASAAGGAGLRLPHGTVPTTPTNGDLWTTTAGVFWRINGVTKTTAFTDSSITGSAGSVANAVTFNNGGTGAASGSTFNGSGAITVSFNTVGAAPAVTPITSWTTSKTAADADNNQYQKFTGGAGQTLTLDATPAAGVAFIEVNRGSAALALAVAGGLYKNGASGTATTGTLAIGGKITLVHEGGGVWTADGSGLS
jgi:hypothetical protein